MYKKCIAVIPLKDTPRTCESSTLTFNGDLDLWAEQWHMTFGVILTLSVTDLSSSRTLTLKHDFDIQIDLFEPGPEKSY